MSLVSYTKKREIKIYLDQHLYMYLSIFLSFHFAFGNPMTTGKTVHPWFLEVVTGFKQILPFLCLATRQLYSQKLDNVVSGQLYYEPNVIEEVFCGSGSLLEIMHSHFGGFLFFPFENFTLRPTALFIRVSGWSEHRSCEVGNFFFSVWSLHFSAERSIMVLQDSLPRCFEAAFYIEMQTDRTTEISVATEKLEASPTVEENSGSIHMIKNLLARNLIGVYIVVCAGRFLISFVHKRTCLN